MDRPFFKDAAVREAMYFALDKASIIDALYYGLPQVTESYMPKESYYYNSDLPAHEYNVDKAKELLDQAGWKPGADGIREKTEYAWHSAIRPHPAIISVSRLSSSFSNRSGKSALI